MKITVHIRPSYSDTDQMGFVHHSNYVKFYETARWEAFRYLGIPYKKIEDNGILMPVIVMNFKFIKPAYYDDLLKIQVRIEQESGIKIHFKYQMFNQDQELINQAETTLACIKSSSRKPCRIPDYVLEAICEKSPATAIDVANG